MKKSLILQSNSLWATGITALFLAMLQAASAQAASYWVAPDGNDHAAGSLEQPFASIHRAQKAVQPGDTVYLRGGRYELTEAHISRKYKIWAYLHVLDKSGRPGKPITYRPHEQERPIFDCSQVKPAGLRIDAFYITGSWLHLQGIEVTGVQVTMKGHTQSICFDSNGSHNIFEGLRMHDGQAIGIYHVRGSNNLFLNCDAWNNWDYTSEKGKGGNVDGFGCHPTKGSTGNVFRGCRAWYNSDDAFDLISAHEVVILEDCWALYSGRSAKGDKLGDGNGFKAGGFGNLRAKDLPRPIPRHIIRNCIAAGNPSSGFYANHHPGGIDWVNNSAFRNGTNFNLLGRLGDNQTDVDGYGHTLRNNVSYHARGGISRIDRSRCALDNNAFAPEAALNDQDFVSLDETELLGTRRADGGLPAIHFLQLSSKSPYSGRGAPSP